MYWPPTPRRLRSFFRVVGGTWRDVGKLMLDVLTSRKSIDDMYAEFNTAREGLSHILQENQASPAGQIASEMYPRLNRVVQEQVIPFSYIRETREWMDAILNAEISGTEQVCRVILKRIEDTLEGRYSARFVPIEIDPPDAGLVACLQSGDGAKAFEILEKVPTERALGSLPQDDRMALVHTVVTDEGTFAIVTQRARSQVILCPSATRQRIASILRGWMWLYYWHSAGIYEKTLEYIAQQRKIPKRERPAFEQAAWRIPYHLIFYNEHIIQALHPTEVPSAEGKPTVPFPSWILMEVMLLELGAGYTSPGAGLWKYLDRELAARGVKRVILCSDKALAIFPHHAAILDLAQDGQKEFVLDGYELTYLPQGKLTSIPHKPTRTARVLVLGDENLPLSSVGISTLQNLDPKRVKTKADAANFYALRESLSMVDALTFVGHAQYNWEKHEESYLQMTDRRMSLKRFLNAVPANLSMVTLAACGIGLPEIRPRMSDYRGFPEDLLLKGGVPVITSTLWPVHQLSTVLLMRDLHRRLLNAAVPDEKSSFQIAAALRRSQQWLRSLTVTQIIEELGSLAALANAKEIAKEIENIQTQILDHPYAHPYFWAPFYVMGGIG
jgi:CHAT domain-containing protein